jgi:hypothetical protein
LHNNSSSDIIGTSIKYIPEPQHNEYSNKFYILTYGWNTKIKIYLNMTGYIEYGDSFRDYAWKLVDNAIQIINMEGDLVETIKKCDDGNMWCDVWHGHGYCQLELA